jgi:ribose 5-phosphate isomerase B
MKIYFAADHAGIDLKAELIKFVGSLSTAGVPYDVEDCGAFEFDKADDYPDFVGRAGKKLAADAQAGTESRAVVIGASGQGEAMAMNRFVGVRCALYYGEPSRKQIDMSGKELDMISSSREHNNANALSFGARFLTSEEAQQILKKWLTVAFSGDTRHERRIQKLDALQ